MICVYVCMYDMCGINGTKVSLVSSKIILHPQGCSVE